MVEKTKGKCIIMSFFRYPGGKRKLRDTIAKRLKEYYQAEDLQYREPFFGGGSIGMCLLKDVKPSSMWINDFDIGIYCIWMSVCHYPAELCDRINSFHPKKDDFHTFRKELTTLKHLPIDAAEVVDIGFKKIAIHQISYSGLGTKSGGPLGGEKQESEYKIDCRWSPPHMTKQIKHLSEILGPPLKLSITAVDFKDTIADTSEKALLYLDPPYYVKGNDLYQCAFTLDDHIRLALALRDTKHKWLLSYDDCPEVRALYKWATIEPLSVKYSITTARTKSELLIYPNDIHT